VGQLRAAKLDDARPKAVKRARAIQGIL